MLLAFKAMAANTSMNNYDENLLLSLPSHLAMTGSNMRAGVGDGMDTSLNGMGGGSGGGGGGLIPISTQNYMDKYRELEKILGDEKKTNDEFKKFYKALKTDHTRIKAESLDLRSQMTGLIGENKMMQDKYKAMFEKMQQELRRKQILIEELKNKVQFKKRALHFMKTLNENSGKNNSDTNAFLLLKGNKRCFNF